MKLEKGLKVWVRLGRVKEAGIILDFTDSRGIGDYSQVKVQLLKVNPFAPDQLLRSTYPKPIQSILLTLRYPVEMLPGEEQ